MNWTWKRGGHLLLPLSRLSSNLLTTSRYPFSRSRLWAVSRWYDRVTTARDWSGIVMPVGLNAWGHADDAM